MAWTLYVDIDAYYVSCELRDRPELLGRPVIVGPDPRLGPTRGVVLSASYEARAFGVRSALPVGQALRLCPDAVWIPADHRKYEAVAHEVRAYLGRRFPRVVALSIDEAACEVEVAGPQEARAAGLALQASLRSDLRLPASIGASVHRVVAKIASDRAKPGGVVVVAPTETAAFLAPLPVRVVPGVGPKTAERLTQAGVTTIGDLLTARPAALRKAVGSFAFELLALARGEPAAHAADESGPRSRSAAETFLEDEGDPARLAEALQGLAVGLARSLAEEGLWFRSVTVAVRWENFEHGQRGRTLAASTDDPAVLATTAARLMTELRAKGLGGAPRRVRTLSLSVGRLSAAPPSQRRLDAFTPGAEGTVKSGTSLSDRASS